MAKSNSNSKFSCGQLYARMTEDLHLGGMSERTHSGYLRAVRQLADYSKTAPNKITEDQLRRFFLHLKNEKKFAYGSLRVAFSGIKFFYTRSCKRNWQTLAQMKLQNVKSLPEVLTIRQVHQIMDAATTPRMAIYFWTVYSLGLRMLEGLNLQVGDIDGDWMMVHVHRGKGAKDGYVPLPSSTLDLLRLYWVTHRHKRFLFPTEGRDHQGASTAQTTMSPTAVQGAIKKITKEIDFGKKVSLHTLRHSYGTHLLDIQSRRLMPVQHFLVTFTVPKELRRVLRSCQRDGYGALFDVAAELIRDIGSATKSLRGCHLGFFGVLHTWGRDPRVYHPHIHFVVPGGGVSEDRSQWKSTPKNFLFHHGALLNVNKAKLADALRACNLYDRVPFEAWRGKFVVDIKPVGDGRAVLKYLAPYVHRVAISDNRIVASDETSVTYRYTPSGTKRSVTRRVTGTEFVRGFVQHTLPRGFQRT